MTDEQLYAMTVNLTPFKGRAPMSERLTQPERIAKLEVELGDAEDRIDHAEHVAAIAEFNERAALRYIAALEARVAKLEAALKKIRDIGGLGWSIAEAALKDAPQ